MLPSRAQVSASLSEPLPPLENVVSWFRAKAVFVDVRRDDETATGVIPGAICIPHDQIASRVEELSSSRDATVVCYCRTGPRAEHAQQVLRNQGFKDVQNGGGFTHIWDALLNEGLVE
jgi:rhodanese-related sulfurtransferase